MIFIYVFFFTNNHHVLWLDEHNILMHLEMLAYTVFLLYRSSSKDFFNNYCMWLYNIHLFFESDSCSLYIFSHHSSSYIWQWHLLNQPWILYMFIQNDIQLCKYYNISSSILDKCILEIYCKIWLDNLV